MSKDNGSSFITGFLVGGIVGVAVGILFASSEDSSTREKMSNKATEFKNKANNFSDILEENIRPSVEVIREQVIPKAESLVSNIRNLSTSQNGSSENETSTGKNQD